MAKDRMANNFFNIDRMANGFLKNIEEKTEWRIGLFDSPYCLLPFRPVTVAIVL
jgi:hypothetical protein